MLIYIVMVLGIIITGTMLIFQANPSSVDRDFNNNINKNIISSTIDYAFDKNFLETDEKLKGGYYNIGYFVDGSNESDNDTVKINYLGNTLNNTVYQDLGTYHYDQGVISQFINGEDNDHSLAIRVIPEHVGTNGSQTIYKVDVVRVGVKPSGGYRQDVMYTFYK